MRDPSYAWPMRIVLVDDHAEVRRSVRWLLEHGELMEVVGEASDGAEALEMVARTLPDAVLVDLHLPDARGADCVGAMRARFGDLRIVAWSAETVGAEEARRAGADAFVLKGEPLEILIEALTAAGPIRIRR